MKIRITSDSTCDLSPQQIEKNGVRPSRTKSQAFNTSKPCPVESALLSITDTIPPKLSAALQAAEWDDEA